MFGIILHMSTIQEYLTKVSADEMYQYERIREIVLHTIPEAEQVMSYGMPTFKYKGKTVLHFGVFKDHLSLFPGSGSVYERMGGKLDSFRTSKGTLRFTLMHPIPDELIEEIVNIRLSDIIGG